MFAALQLVRRPISRQVCIFCVPFVCFVPLPARFSFSLLPSQGISTFVTLFSFFFCRFLSSFWIIAHEYIKVDGNEGTCGITDFAQSALGDIVFVDLPEPGDEFEKGDSFGSVESVKAASDVYAPVSGTVAEVNTKLSDEPGLVNSDAEGDAWFIKVIINDPDQLKGLMDPEAYKAHCEKAAAH
jgi:glycine cleavage system H protein